MPFQKGHKFGRRFQIGHIFTKKTGYFVSCKKCGKEFYKKKSKSTKFCSEKCYFQTLKGRKLTKETIKKMVDSRKRNYCKEKHPCWKGGITSERKKLYFSKEYKLWRESVFRRDNFTCIWCGTKGERLNADHIKPWCNFPELRFAIDNGRTLCDSCHRKTDTYARHKQ